MAFLKFFPFPTLRIGLWLFNRKNIFPNFKKEKNGTQTYSQENYNLLLWWVPLEKKGTILKKYTP